MVKASSIARFPPLMRGWRLSGDRDQAPAFEDALDDLLSREGIDVDADRGQRATELVALPVPGFEPVHVGSVAAAPLAAADAASQGLGRAQVDDPGLQAWPRSASVQVTSRTTPAAAAMTNCPGPSRARNTPPAVRLRGLGRAKVTTYVTTK